MYTVLDECRKLQWEWFCEHKCTKAYKRTVTINKSLHFVTSYNHEENEKEMATTLQALHYLHSTLLLFIYTIFTLYCSISQLSLSPVIVNISNSSFTLTVQVKAKLMQFNTSFIMSQKAGMLCRCLGHLWPAGFWLCKHHTCQYTNITQYDYMRIFVTFCHVMLFKQTCIKCYILGAAFAVEGSDFILSKSSTILFKKKKLKISNAHFGGFCYLVPPEFK